MTRKATTTLTEASHDPLIGRQLGDYRLTGILAMGGMAKIYRAMDYQLQRQAAVKVLPLEHLSSDRTLAKRFQREARAVAALEHDNIITIYQYGEQEGVYFLAMKLVKGKDLAQELKRLKRAQQRMDIRRALHILEQVASALDYAHAAGVVHRDIKPSNILLDDTDKATLTDFGLVLRASAETTMGTAFGTPRYIAPEQAISSNKALPQSDIYALAVILYEILCDDTPFGGDSPMEIALSHISEAPPPPRSKNAAIPPAVEREIMKALDKSADKRHRTALEFVHAVRKGYGMNLPEPTAPPVLKPPAAPPRAARQIAALPRAPRRPAALIAALLVLLVVVAALIVWGGSGRIAGAPGAPVTLIYDEATFTMINGGDYSLDAANLKFIRGEDDASDDYDGDRIKQNILPPGACARVILMERQASAPAACASEHSLERLADPTRFFWRQETQDGGSVESFTVSYKDQVVTTCATITRGGSGECHFTWPVVPASTSPG